MDKALFGNPKSLRRDPFFWAALAAAILYWVISLATSSLSKPWGMPSFSPALFLPLFLYPIFEEILFRGFLQGEMLRTGWGEKTWKGWSVANLFTSLAFSLAHAVFSPWIHAIGVFFPSLIFGFFRDRTGSLFPSIFLHVFYNLGFFLFVR